MAVRFETEEGHDPIQSALIRDDVTCQLTTSNSGVTVWMKCSLVSVVLFFFLGLYLFMCTWVQLCNTRTLRRRYKNLIHFLSQLSRYRDRLRFGRPGLGSRQGQEIFIFSAASTPSMGATQSPIQWVTGAISPGVKRPNTHLHLVPRLNAGAKPSLPHMSLWRGNLPLPCLNVS
jgi:hypothetical protein